ncbi:MAG: anthranilate phosphoribosyltransferase [Gammaproteobacteria bacterium]
MSITSILRTLVDGRNLNGAEMEQAMRAIMSGEATPAQIGGLLIGLRVKGETVEEIAAAASVMRELVTPVRVHAEPLIDTCGTGGDKSNTFNISTTSAFVVAAAGGKVAKHGNRSVSSTCGSADVLEAAGARLDLTPEAVARCIETLGVGFMYAPAHHAATRHAVGPRRELGVRTLFNVLGPLTNPAGAKRQVIGLYSAHWLEPLAEVLRQLGSVHVLLVHAQDGLDEISLAASTEVAELNNGDISRYRISPEDIGVVASNLDDICVRTPGESLALVRTVLANKPGPALEIVCANAGAAIYTCGLSSNIAEGVDRARTVIASGAAQQAFESFIRLTQSSHQS